MKKAALIGLGMVADTHVAAFRDTASAEIVAVMGRDPEKTGAFAAAAETTTGRPVRSYTSIEDLIAKETLDFSVLATPPDARHYYVQQLAKAGVPILVEKPLERSFDRARAIVDLCEAAQVPLHVVFQHRYRAASLALKRALETGALGTVVSAEIRVPWWREQAYYDVPGRGTRARDGGGVMITQAIHTLDLALWLLGPFRRIQAVVHRTVLHRMECEDWAAAIFETIDGCVGTMTATTAAFPGGSESITLCGSLASAHLEAGVLTVFRRDGTQEVTGQRAGTGGGADPMAFTHRWHQCVLEGFVDCLNGEQHVFGAATGRDALAAQAVIDAMERASQSGTWQEVHTT